MNCGKVKTVKQHPKLWVSQFSASHCLIHHVKKERLWHSCKLTRHGYPNPKGQKNRALIRPAVDRSIVSLQELQRCTAQIWHLIKRGRKGVFFFILFFLKQSNKKSYLQFPVGHTLGISNMWNKTLLSDETNFLSFFFLNFQNCMCGRKVTQHIKLKIAMLKCGGSIILGECSFFPTEAGNEMMT